MKKTGQPVIYKNLANLVSLLGVLPICLLFGEHGYQYLLPLIIYNNFMDDLDGVLAAMLNIRSDFGARLDNVCDAIPHTVFVMFVGMHFAEEAGHAYLDGIFLASCLLASSAIILRVVNRVNPKSHNGTGSPTNELIRHIFFVLIVTEYFAFYPVPFLIAVCLFHSISMLVRFKMPFLLRSLTQSVPAIFLVNVALLLAWLVPSFASVIAAAFFATYLMSFLAYGSGSLKSVDTSSTH